jgi:hypothetical protein
MAVEPTTFDEPDVIVEVELTDEERAILEEEESKLAQQRKDAFRHLAHSIEDRFSARAIRRKTKELEWRKSMELYLGNLSTSDFQDSDRPFSEVRNHSNRPYYNLVANKCEIAIAQSVDMQFAGGEKNWSLSAAVDNPDPVEADKKRRMEKTIEAQLERCSYGRKSRMAIEDRVILGTGILKGPVNTGKVYTKYVPLGDGTTWVPQPSVDRQPSIERVNPWFFFPDDSVSDFSKVSDTIEVHVCSAMDLKKWMYHPGFIPEALEEALKTTPEDWFVQRYIDCQYITDSNPYLHKEKYMVLEYHGPISVSDLTKLSVELPPYDPINEDYYGEVWVVGGHVIRIELENIEASFEVPYALSNWKKDPSSVFGYGSPLLMKDSQRVARETWRMILDNASLSSGPQIAMHRQFVEPANGSWVLHPGKAWNLLDSSVDVEKAIQFFTVDNVTADLIPILDLSRQMAEEESMTPMIAAGLQGSDATESATGQLIMRESSTTILDFLSEDWDDNVTEKVIRRMYGWNMQYNPDPSIKGDYSVDVRTSSEYKNKQMYIRDMERLSMELKQNPEAAMMINQDELFRARLAMMKLPSAAIVKSDEEIQAAREAAAQQPNPEMIELQIKQQQVAIEAEKLQLQKAQLQFEQQQQQVREMMEHEERMSANRARELEALATVTRTQNEKEIQFLQLAQRAESEAERNRIMAMVSVMNDTTKKFQIQAEANKAARKDILTIKEMEIKTQQGSGI